MKTWWVFGGCLVGVEATPTHPASPVNKGSPIVFHPFLVGVDEKFLKIIILSLGRKNKFNLFCSSLIYPYI